MHFRVAIILAGAALLSASPVWADTVTWSLSGPTGALGTSESYTTNGTTITVYGFDNSKPADLFGKAAGGDENGVGLVGRSDGEIYGVGAVQLDLTQLIQDGYTNGQLTIGSVQRGETFDVWGSNAKGQVGTLLIKNGTLDDVAFLIPDFGKYSYISITSPTGDVLLDSVKAETPEPGTLALVGAGFVGLSGFLRRKLRRA